MRERRSILVVDDNPAIRQLLKRFLSSRGYEVFTANDADDGWRLLQDHGVDLVITDVHMPGRSGIDLLREIRTALPNIPVMIMTAKPSVEAAVECIKSGAHDYLLKPLALQRLGGMLEGIFREGQAKVLDKTATLGSHRPSQGSLMGSYHVVRTLGQGSMGIVFLAEKEVDHQIQRYALKIMKPDLLAAEGEAREKWVKRFCREAELASRVKHPAVVSIIEYDVFGSDQTPYLVMEYCDGIPLNRWREENRASSYEERVSIIRQLADGISAVHAQGVCHRDIKPHNVLVDDALNAKLADFGIARPLDLTVTTQLMGTPAYMAPEAFLSTGLDQRSDIFSLGVLAYELLLGKRPFIADSLPAFIRAVQTEEPVPPAEIEKDFPTALSEILARLLAKNPEERYQSAGDTVRDLDAFVKSRPY